MVMAEDSDVDIGSEDELHLGTMIARLGLNEDHQPNVLTSMPNLDNDRKLAQNVLDKWMW